MTTLKLDAKALQALIATFDEETKLEFQRCVIKEVVNKSFLNDLGLEEKLKESLTVKIDKAKLALNEHTKTLIDSASFILQSKVEQAITEMVLDQASFQITDELCEKLIGKLLRRSSAEKHVQDYEERWKGRIRIWTEELHTTKAEFNKLLKELQQKIDNQEQMVAGIVARRLTGKE